MKFTADSLNRRLWLLELQERMVHSQLTGAPLQAGRVRYEDYLAARIDLLKHMEGDVKVALRRQYSELDSMLISLQEDIRGNEESEIEELEGYLARYPDGRYVADANFILGQLYYAKESRRNLLATKRWQAEFARYRMGLIPVMPPLGQAQRSHRRTKLPDGDQPRYEPGTDPVFALFTREIPHRACGRYQHRPVRRASVPGAARGSPASPEPLLLAAGLSKGRFCQTDRRVSEDSVNVPEALYVLASHYNLIGGSVNRDTAQVYAEALIRDHWYSPRYQDALMLLAELHFQKGLPEVTDAARRNKLFSDGLAYLAWMLREIDAYEAQKVPGVTTEERLGMISSGKRDRAIEYMVEIICRVGLTLRGVDLSPPPAVPTTVNIVRSSGKPPFGADLLRKIGDRKKNDFQTSNDQVDLRASLAAYDTLLSYYPTYEDGPAIQLQIIERAPYLADNPAEQYDILLREMRTYYDLFNRNSAWYRTAEVPATVKAAADDSAASYLETVAKQHYSSARASGDQEQLRKSLDEFVEYFETYPERPQAYELNWSLATELESLGDSRGAYEQYTRLSRAQQGKYRRRAAQGAVEAALQLYDQEVAAQPAEQEQPVEGEQ